MSAESKFLSKIVKNANNKGCWYLKSDDGSKFKTEFYLNKKKFIAKRFSYEYFCKKVESGLKVLCKCGDKLCINPKHHFAGNGKDHIQILYKHGWKQKSGWKMSPEAIQKISKIHKGKTISPELRERLRKANLGKKHSLKTRKKMSENRIGIPVPEEARKKIAASKQGQKNWNTRLSEADILKIRKLAGNKDSKPKGKRVKLGKYTITEIAEMFGISPVHVINIRRRKVWKHID
jgi:rRNA maturation endonuclease Nob1